MPERRLRIMHVLEASIGGTRKHLMQLLAFRDRKTFEFAVVISQLRNPEIVAGDIAQMRADGVAVFEIPMLREVSPMKDIRAFFALRRAIEQFKPDVIHTHASKAGALGRFAAATSGISAIMHTPHLWPFAWEDAAAKNVFYTGFERVIATLTGRIIAVAHAQRNAALKLKISDRQFISVVENRIETAPRSRDRLRLPSAPVFGCAVRLVPQKGVEILLDAVPEIVSAFPSARVIIGGSGPLEGELKARAKKSSAHANIEFAGEIDDIGAFLGKLDVYVSTSLWEGLPYGVLEAMANGVPVVASNIDGVRDIVFEDCTGRLFSSGSSNELAEACIRAIRDWGTTSRMAETAVNRVMRNSPEEAVRYIEWLYLRLETEERPFV